MNYQPKYPVIKSELNKQDNTYTLSVGPLLPGFGHTLGNSLRRVLLSSLPGFAVTKVKINDLTHEYQTIDKVKEDALDVVLNLKSLRAKILTDAESAKLILKTNKAGEIFARDFNKNGEVEITNPDLYICTLSDGGKLNIEIEIARGVGYITYEKKDLRGNQEPTSILIDSVFSPIKNVSLDVEQVRVGDRTDFDQINIAFETDGTISGEEAVEYSLKLILDMMQNIHSSLGASADLKKTIKSADKPKSDNKNDSIGLPTRILRILEKNGIITNKQLKAKKSEVSEFSGLGDKAIEEIENYLKNL